MLQINLCWGDSLPSGSSIVRFLALVRPCLGDFPPNSAHDPSIFYALLLLFFVSVSSSYFTLAVSVRGVSCIGYHLVHGMPVPCSPY